MSRLTRSADAVLKRFFGDALHLLRFHLMSERLCPKCRKNGDETVLRRVPGSETPLTNYPESVRFTLECPACDHQQYGRT